MVHGAFLIRSRLFVFRQDGFWIVLAKGIPSMQVDKICKKFKLGKTESIPHDLGEEIC